MNPYRRGRNLRVQNSRGCQDRSGGEPANVGLNLDDEIGCKARSPTEEQVRRGQAGARWLEGLSLAMTLEGNVGREVKDRALDLFELLRTFRKVWEDGQPPAR